MRRMPIRHRIAPLAGEGCPPPASCGISRGFPRLYPCGGQVAYVLLTRAPVAGGRIAAPPLPLDLHVLSLSLAFILSQDQTLRCWLSFFIFFLSLKRSKKSNLILSLCCLHGHPAYKTARRSPAMSSSIESEELTLGSFCNDSCTTS